MVAKDQTESMKNSIGSLSNMVFGVALSIGALTLINSVSSSSATFGSIASNIETFGLSFLIIIFIWLRYTKGLKLMNIETGLEVGLNIIILFLVSIEPYLLYLLNTATTQLVNLTSALYALNIAGLFIVLYIFYRIGIKSGRDSDKEIADYYKPLSNSLLLSGIIFGVSALPFFGSIIYLISS